jgi:Rho GDP-dissociation inhibitor
LSGLHYVQIVKRKGIRVSKDQEMIVSWNTKITSTGYILMKKIGLLCSQHR